MKYSYHILAAFFLVFTQCSVSSQLPTDPVGAKVMLNADISFLASDDLEGREVGSIGEQKAALYIAGRMRELDLKPAGDGKSFEQLFTVKKPANPHAHGVEFGSDAAGSTTGRNVLGFLDNGAKTTVVIGAHYDHLGYGGEGSLSVEDSVIHNGADDNASGVAGMLYLANALKECCNNNNYLFLAFSGEEKGLWGSNYFTKNPTIDLGTVNYMINMDMIGRLNEDRAIAVNGTGTASQWEEAVTGSNSDSLKIVMKASGIGPSDHTSFYLSNIPVLQFFTGQHEDYHKPTDDIEKINFDGMLEVLNLIHGVIEELDDDGKLAFLETPEEPGQSMRSFKVTLGVIPDYLYDGTGMRIDGVKPDRPADKAGLVKGDIVLKMGDVEVENMNSYMEALSKFEPGQKITVQFKRDDEVMEKPLTFDE